MIQATSIFWAAVIDKLAGWNASYLIVPNTTPLSERKAIIRAVKQELPDAEVRLTPHGEEIYPGAPELEIDKLESLIRRVNPSIAIQMGAAKTRGGGAMHRKPQFGQFDQGISQSSGD